jgi:DNA-binding sugar fermentation-stimulating protein
MKSSYFIAMLLVLTGFFSSCSKDFAYSSEFDKSYEAYQKYKKENANSYQYTVTSSSWTGTHSATTITVFNGQVEYRSYEAKTRSADGKEQTDTKWTENKDELNSHDEGYEALTLDQVYEKAKKDWLIKRKDSKVYFEAKNNGLISSAGYVPDNCQDDCFNGIHISEIKFPISLNKN